MKAVTIPTCANPFVVIVNGIKYTYPAGATMEVPDDVAEVIEQHEEAKTEPAPVQPPYSGGMNGDDILAEAKAYTDKQRLAYAEKESKVLLELGPYDNDADNAMPANGHWEIMNGRPCVVELGKTYLVTTESGTFSVVCTGFDDAEYNEYNRYLKGDSFEYFAVGMIGSSPLSHYAEDKNGGNTFIISEEAETLHPIDQKFIPAMDSITLNGADGKQYKLTVDASGALAVTAVI